MKAVIKIIVLVFLTSLIIDAQNLTGRKLCIDPGHGGHDAANDRHVLPPDFWESESNFSKALHLKEILESLGAQVILTRTGNDDSDDLGLSERDAIANANNVDYFHSIHSNATGTSSRVNYPLILYRGYDNTPVYPEAKTFAQRVWSQIYSSRSSAWWSYHTMVIRGDWTFYNNTSGLGVLRSLTMPGTLSEGSFHDYIVEAWRLKNDSYRRHEAWSIARAFLDHYNAGNLKTGIIAGLVRDNTQTVPSSYQPLSGTNDNKLPINYVKVTLTPGDKTYLGDDQNNGYYMFDNLEPGTYKLIFDEEFHAKDSATVTVTAHKSVFVDKLLKEVPNYSTPTVITTFPADQSINQSTRDTVEVQFDIRMDRTSTQNAFSISPSVQGEFIWGNGDKKLMFFPLVPFNQQTLYTVKVNTSAKTAYNINLANDHSFQFTTGTAASAQVVSFYPAEGDIGVSNTAEISISFDTEMNAITTEAAFSITPATTGAFTWSSNNKTLKFKPTKSYKAGEKHQVKISTEAKTYFGGNLQSDFTFNFTTREKLNLISTYPVDKAEDISKTVLIRIQFEMPIQAITLPGNVIFYDEDSSAVDISVNTSTYSKGIIEFEPRKSLETGKTYRILLKSGIGDVENVFFGEDKEILFTTEKTVYSDGIVFEPFESTGTWLQPSQSSNSVGIHNTASTFSVVSSRKFGGNKSGQLNYTFVSSNGLCEVSNSVPVEVNTITNGKLGLWVFGDLSYNELEYIVSDSFGLTSRIAVGVIDWTGWKMKTIEVSSSMMSGRMFLNAIAVRRMQNSEASGVIYLDEAQTDLVAPVKDVLNGTPIQYTLAQNFPNPFNPTTVINFSLPENTNVSLEIYNSIGQLVDKLIDDKNYVQGYHHVTWNGLNSAGNQLPSGIYFYSLKTDKFQSFKKMILLK